MNCTGASAERWTLTSCDEKHPPSPKPNYSDNNELPEHSICWDDLWQWSCYTFGDQHWLEDFGVTWETLDERAGTAWQLVHPKDNSQNLPAAFIVEIAAKGGDPAHYKY